MAVKTLDQTRVEREREVANALASVRMEGLARGAGVAASRWVEGFEGGTAR